MEVLVEEHVVAEMGIVLQALVRSEHGTTAMRVAQEEIREPSGQLIGDLPECEEDA